MKKYIVAPGFWGLDLTASSAVGYGGKASVGRTITVSHWNMPLSGGDFHWWNAFHQQGELSKTSGGTCFGEGGCSILAFDCPGSALAASIRLFRRTLAQPQHNASNMGHHRRLTSTTEPGVPYCQQTPALQDVFSRTANLQVKLPLPPRFPLLHPMKIPADPGNSEPAGGQRLGFKAFIRAAYRMVKTPPYAICRGCRGCYICILET